MIESTKTETIFPPESLAGAKITRLGEVDVEVEGDLQSYGDRTATVVTREALRLDEVVPETLVPLVGTDGFLRTLPYRDGLEAFFAAALVRR